jgi:ribose-phosphate pyrophosphokinase
MLMTAASEILFNHETNVAPLGIIATESVTELGNKINGYLVDWAKKGGYDKETFFS